LNLPADGRVALYWAPTPDDPLWEAGNNWLGRDPATNAPLAQPDLPEIAAITQDARLYGFHATMKPPMRLNAGCDWNGFVGRAREVVASVASFDLPPLALMDLDGFLALGLTRPCAALRALCDACVAGLDEFRAPPSEAELARRRRIGLSLAREAMLQRWGYPDVFDIWVFHMTLTRRLTEAEAAIYRPAAEAHFAAALAAARQVRDICVFAQEAPQTPFTIVARLPLRR
jgi:hypothetical protein